MGFMSAARGGRFSSMGTADHEKSTPRVTPFDTDKGLPRYRDSVDSDIFILSGAEDLVPVLLPEADTGPRVDELEREGYRVCRYRPRIEGLFARIERWTHIESGDAHWRSLSNDNVLTIYGLDPESRIADPDNTGHVFSWLICQSYDDTGNAIIQASEKVSEVYLTVRW